MKKIGKKDGLNPPVFPLAGLMLLIRSHPVRPPCVRVDACVCVCAPVRLSVRVVVWCAPECTRGGLEGRLSVRVVVLRAA